MSNNLDILKIRGTKDKLQEEKFNEKQLVKKVLDFLENFGFSEIEAPVIESQDLYLRAIGQETDIVKKELFSINSLSASEKPCLRPEFTAGVFRMFLENKHLLTTPWKNVSVGPCFRYERPQKGRWRQFDQISAETIGSTSVFNEIEMLIAFDQIFSNVLALTNTILKINYLGTSQDRQNYRSLLVDFLTLNKDNLCSNCVTRTEVNPLRVLDCKVESCQKILQTAPKITESLSVESKANFDKIKIELEFNSINFIVDANLVRGLDYYTGIVFEMVATSGLGAQNALGGGGCYDLAQSFGLEQEIPCVGFGIGLSRLILFLQEQNLLSFKVDKKRTKILPLEPEVFSLSLIIANHLRNNGVSVEIDFSQSAVKTLVKNAIKQGFDYGMFIGTEELNNNTVKIKNFHSQQEQVINQGELLNFFGT